MMAGDWTESRDGGTQGQVCSEAVTRAGADYCKTINNSWTSHYSPKLGHRIQSPPSEILLVLSAIALKFWLGSYHMYNALHSGPFSIV